MLRRMGHSVPDDVVYVEHDGVPQAGGRDAVKAGASIGELFAPAYLRDTIALCLSFFFCLMVNYIGILLIPIMFTGFSLFLPSGLAVYMLTSYLFGILQQLYVNHLDRKGKITV